ncbi:4-hydroxyphenylpyruvate dioxygenase [Verminephrobacter eiseniae]|uniref:4-hydroxyphenylpyruvate dioxygenase n=1 Tax=Verminephrobacter eiseniae TaxID=364317 RepID=UPI002237CA4E|nr:4-hydroxyphenylpyruvate dioxygenase [Verminephrobacter eiseniae]MCW5229940.1 4-hydroxyphenylpyruvate dioxygenase [Verminephrobacter eiseniae]MCW5291672.1 4-hydroxyphenylpyruvate dioxygenase [Verminephrobacter eiseniae]MCW8183439.1 4-hydroxyphenylpyruvate dioxygenase [Verminephrobacter eiseniae]MCW8221706.1 4-hydroxyphenylpyruvate dioxygenase [Verminephrobacter eiseniae]MCW8233444.1 4-hydroxyphenylpyruvate dioxygenase [Verminephrobacter eiseniae]
MNAALPQPAATPVGTGWDNPMGTDGFEFIEFAAPDPQAMGRVFVSLGFRPVARHRHKAVTLYRQGQINFIINAEPDSFAQRFARQHGPSVCAIALRVHDAKAAYGRALDLGAWGYAGTAGPGELNIPALKGLGDSLIYLVDRWRGKNGAQPGDIGDIAFFDVDFEPLPGISAAEALNPRGHGLSYIDHLTHNVHRGRMNEWADFYQRLFNFRELRYFDIEGQLTGVKSRAMTSPCGKIRIPINEEGRERAGQIQEYLDRYKGEGIQHIAMGADNLYHSVDALRRSGVRLLDTLDTYYELVEQRIPGHGEPLQALKERKILIDGSAGKLLLQIFSENLLGPIFFEFIQRKGDDGFGNGNFKALFESMELDQMRRGVLG